MKTRKSILPRLLSFALVLLLALTAAVPAFAADSGTKVDPKNQANLTITIKNNEGLPGMTPGQFTAYQLFIGTPTKETPDPDPNVTQNEWEAENWNNYNLANVEWGANINGADLMAGLKLASQTDWPGLFDADGKGYVQKYTEEGNSFSSAADLAKFLVGKPNSFLQEFSRFVMEGSKEGTKGTGLLKDKDNAKKSTVTYNADNDADDESSITVSDTGYYLIVENGEHKDADAVSEYILAVLGDQTINLKASVPTVDKNIVSGKDAEGADVLLKGDAVGISDTVTYRINGTLPKNFGDFDSYEYYFHDTLSKGLTYNSDTANLTVTVTLTKTDGSKETYKIALAAAGDTAATGYQVETHKLTAEDVAEGGEYHGKYTTADVGKTLIDIKFTDLKKLQGTLMPDGVDLVTIPFNTAKSYDQGNVLFTVEYSVTVNSDAVIGSTGNPNEVYLEYSNDPNHDGTGETEEKKVIVYSFALDLTKVGSDNKNKDGLAGAGFVMSKKVGTKTYYAEFEDVYQDPEAEPKVVIGRRLKGWVEQSKEAGAGKADVSGMIDTYKAKKAAFDNATKTDQGNENSVVSKELKAATDALAPYLLESGTDGKIPLVSGMDAGDYTLTEVITPAGYNTMADIEFTINAVTQTEEKEPTLVELSGTLTPDTDGAGRKDVTFDNADLANGKIPGKLQNQKAPFLPFTGGIGTLIFYVLGIALIGGAVTYLVIASKKRKKAEENA